ncbi:MAG: exonuclease SbcCD subunit D, partial [Clostridia bacterium]|nr:exonuclease SbcCD subunit D [Clostridia bacterium]
ADLHLGKRVLEYSTLEDARAVVSEIIDIALAEGVDGVLIAGDVYDRPVPPVEAVSLFSQLLTALAASRIPVFAVAGNHDSPERLAFGHEILGEQGIYIAPACNGRPVRITLEGDVGRVAVHMVSFARPAALRPFLEEAPEGATDAMRAVLRQVDFGAADVNILLTHAFVMGGVSSESEINPVGTAELIPTDVFAGFDYVALGHLHGPQTVAPGVRYAGSPLKYSFSEVDHVKSVTIVEICEKSAVTVREIPLHALHDMREIRGSLAAPLGGEYSEDLIRAVVTDEEVPPDARAALRTVYPNLMRFVVENSSTRLEEDVTEADRVENRDPLSLFAEFYERQSGSPPDEARLAVMKKLLEGEVEL